jgi:site-specific DNA-methyltransferase (adenine-specific)
VSPGRPGTTPSDDPSIPFFRGRAPGGSEVELYLEDCRSGLVRHLAPGSVDVVVTSPPYNLGVPYGRYDDRRPREGYLAFLGEVTEAIDRSLSERGSFFLNISGSSKDPWLPWDAARAVHERFELQNVVHWIKSVSIGRAHAGERAGLDRDLSVGHYKPVHSDRYLHGAHEYVFHFTRHGDVPLDRLAIGVPYQDESNIDRWQRSSVGLRCRGNTWFLPYPTIRRRATDRPHPATFPPELAEWCLKLHGSSRVTRAVDPFLGIGASAIAAARLGIRFTGFEIDPDYLATARDRLAREGVVRAGPPRARSRPAKLRDR